MIKSLYPCFQHWSEKGGVYLVSDTHFKDLDRDYMGYFISKFSKDIFLYFASNCTRALRVNILSFTPEWRRIN